MTQCNLFPFEKTENMLPATVMLIETRIAMFPSRKDNLIKKFNRSMFYADITEKKKKKKKKKN